MKRAALIALVVFGACGSDAQPAGEDAAGGVDTVPADAPDSITDVSANITTDTTWSGLVRIHTDITIATGVTLTVQPGTRIQVAAGDSITVAGTATLAGVKGGVVTIESLT